MKIGIIGSSGFIGSNLFSFLRKNTKYRIFSFSSYKQNKKNWINKVVNEINKKKPNIIVNCSANQNHLGKVEKKYIPNVLNSNLLSNILFINEAIQYKNFKGFIAFGSKMELGDKRNNKPINFYAATKKANDIFFKFYENNKSALISLKIFDTYGSNDKRKKFLTDLLETYKKNKPLNMTAGKQYLDYVHIEDILKLILMIIKDIKLNKLKGFKSFTVSSKNPIRLINLVKKLNKILSKDLKINIGKRIYRHNTPVNPTLKIFNYPGWKPSRKLFNELKDIFDGKLNDV